MVLRICLLLVFANFIVLTQARQLNLLKVEASLEENLLVVESLSLQLESDSVLQFRWVALGNSNLEKIRFTVAGEEIVPLHSVVEVKRKTWSLPLESESKAALVIAYELSWVPSGQFTIPLVLPGMTPPDASEARFLASISLPSDEILVEVFPDEEIIQKGNIASFSSLAIPSMIKGYKAKAGASPWTFAKLADLAVLSMLIAIALITFIVQQRSRGNGKL